MEDTGTSVQEAPQTPEKEQQASVKAELDALMNLNLNGVMPTVQDEPPVLDTPPLDAPPQPQSFEVLKEKFSWESPEAAVREIEELRGLKANPTPSQIKFENEQSEKIFNALKEGKFKDVYEVLSQQERLSALTEGEVTEETAADIFKLAMQIKHKDLTKSEIDYKFNKQYGIPKEPVQRSDELDEEFEERKSAWKETVDDIKMSLVIDAKLLKPELETAKSNIKLPDLQQTVDDGYLQYKKSLEEQPQIEAAMKEIYKPFTPKSIETRLGFKDEANKIEFEFQYEPDGESFGKSVEMALDSSKFLDAFKLPNGEFDNKKYLEAVYFATNKDKILVEAMKQAKNATIKSFLPDNNSGGLQRQFPQQQEVSELDKQMQQALRGYGR